MKRYLRWIVAAEFLFAAGNLHAVEVEVPGLLTDHTVSSIGHDFYRAFSDSPKPRQRVRRRLAGAPAAACRSRA